MKAQKFETSLTLSHSIEIVNEPSSYVPLEPLPTKVGISRGTEKQTVFPTSTTQQCMHHHICVPSVVVAPSSYYGFDHDSHAAYENQFVFFSLPHFTTYFMGFSLFLFSTHFLAYYRRWEIFSHWKCRQNPYFSCYKPTLILKPLMMLFRPVKILLNSCRFFSYSKIAELKRIFKGQKSIYQGFF